MHLYTSIQRVHKLHCTISTVGTVSLIVNVASLFAMHHEYQDDASILDGKGAQNAEWTSDNEHWTDGRGASDGSVKFYSTAYYILSSSLYGCLFVLESFAFPIRLFWLRASSSLN